jgi:hypothetical protein
MLLPSISRSYSHHVHFCSKQWAACLGTNLTGQTKLIELLQSLIRVTLPNRLPQWDDQPSKKCIILTFRKLKTVHNRNKQSNSRLAQFMPTTSTQMQTTKLAMNNSAEGPAQPTTEKTKPRSPMPQTTSCCSTLHDSYNRQPKLPRQSEKRRRKKSNTCKFFISGISMRILQLAYTHRGTAIKY